MKLEKIFTIFNQCCFKNIIELSALTIGRLTIGLCSWAFRGAGGREGGQEEDKEVALVDPHLHKKLKRNEENF